MEIEVVVEIPKGTRNKYETDERGVIWLDRMLFTATRYPEDYGFVPETLADDGDPLDALVPAGDPRSARVTELDDVPSYERTEIAHFFGIYKDLEPGKQTELAGWADRATAEVTIREAMERYRAREAGR
jgi:inorganic pyrophosphatase